MGFTPEEAAKIPYGIGESILEQYLGRINEQIKTHSNSIAVLTGQQQLIKNIFKEIEEIKTKYAKGDMK